MYIESRMKTLAMFLAAALAAAAVQAADQAKSAALVRAMRTDEIAVAGAKRAFLTGSVTDTYGEANAACVKRVAYADFTAGFATVVEHTLTPQEVDQALQFYQSDAGVKYVEGLLRRLRASQGEDSGLPKVAGKEQISPAQVAAIADFSRSDLGHKVMGKQMTESPAALAFGREMMSTIAQKCAKK